MQISIRRASEHSLDRFNESMQAIVDVKVYIIICFLLLVLGTSTKTLWGWGVRLQGLRLRLKFGGLHTCSHFIARLFILYI